MAGSILPHDTDRANTAPAKVSPLRLALRIFRWLTYGGAIVTLLMVFHAAPGPALATSPQAAAHVEQKIAAVEQAAANGQPATLQLDESELNSYLATHLDISPAEGPSATARQTDSRLPTASRSDADQAEQARSAVRDVKIELVDDRVRAYVLFDFHGKNMTLQFEGRLAATNGYLRFEPVSGQIGAMPIPQSALATAMERMMDSPENREKLKLPAEITDLRIEKGQLLATYR